MKRNVTLLAGCQAMFITTASLVIATSPLVGHGLAVSKELSTLPLGMQYIAAMCCTMPASYLMKRIGRRPGFIAGALVGMAGAAICALGIGLANFALFCAGAFLLGIFTSFAQYYRFAAADVATPEWRSRAISLVLTGGLAAAFIGPNLARFTRDLSPGSPFLASYLALIGAIGLSLLLLLFVNIPRPSAEERQQSGRPLLTMAGQPRYVVAVLGAMVAYGVMNVIMTSTPLAMIDHGHPFGDTATVIQWHLVGMFAPSFFTGDLIARFGVHRVMAAGALVLAVCVAVNLSGITVGHFWLGLLLLGVGWNFLFVGATTLLTEAYGPAEKAKAQGLNDLMVGVIVAATSVSAGALHHTIGWTGVNLGSLPALALVLAALLWLRRARGPAQATAGG